MDGWIQEVASKEDKAALLYCTWSRGCIVLLVRWCTGHLGRKREVQRLYHLGITRMGIDCSGYVSMNWFSWELDILGNWKRIPTHSSMYYLDTVWRSYELLKNFCLKVPTTNTIGWISWLDLMLRLSTSWRERHFNHSYDRIDVYEEFVHLRSQGLFPFVMSELFVTCSLQWNLLWVCKVIIFRNHQWFNICIS